jgi:hypothetical protein
LQPVLPAMLDECAHVREIAGVGGQAVEHARDVCVARALPALRSWTLSPPTAR